MSDVYVVARPVAGPLESGGTPEPVAEAAVLGSDAARAVGRFRHEGVLGY